VRGIVAQATQTVQPQNVVTHLTRFVQERRGPVQFFVS